MLTIMTSSETERLTKSIKDEIIEEQQKHQKELNDDETYDASTKEIQNPFVHKVEWNDPYDKLRVSKTFFKLSLSL